MFFFVFFFLNPVDYHYHCPFLCFSVMMEVERVRGKGLWLWEEGKEVGKRGWRWVRGAHGRREGRKEGVCITGPYPTRYLPTYLPACL